MIRLFRQLKCWLGLHQWKQSRNWTYYDMFPCPFDQTYKTLTRHCMRCSKKQHWLPGYGGSEIGCWSPGNGIKRLKMLKVYSFEMRREKEIPSEEILGIGLTDESMADIIKMAVHGPYMQVSRYKLGQMHWYLSQVSIMLIRLMVTAKISELILPIPERETLGAKHALGVREEQETGKVCFTLTDRLTGKEVEYASENSH